MGPGGDRDSHRRHHRREGIPSASVQRVEGATITFQTTPSPTMTGMRARLALIATSLAPSLPRVTNLARTREPQSWTLRHHRQPLDHRHGPGTSMRGGTLTPLTMCLASHHFVLRRHDVGHHSLLLVLWVTGTILLSIPHQAHQETEACTTRKLASRAMSLPEQCLQQCQPFLRHRLPLVPSHHRRAHRDTAQICRNMVPGKTRRLAPDRLRHLNNRQETLHGCQGPTSTGVHY